jgi:hypothetical protein
VRRSRRIARLSCVLLLLASSASAANPSTNSAADATAAKTHLAAASAAYTLGHFAEAYDDYAEVLKNYADILKKDDRTKAEARLKELGQKTGTIAIHVNENQATVSIDEKNLDASQPLGVIRRDVGAHHVHVEKEGFSPFDTTVTVTAAGRAVVEVALVKKAKTGHVSVTDASGEVLRVLVDGLDVGATPWEGDLPPGSHTVAGRSSKSNAPPKNVDVSAGTTAVVVLAPEVATGKVEVTTSDGQGFIIVDGKPVAEGSFAGDLPVGPHTIRVKREGYETFDKKIDLQEHDTIAETVTLRASAGTTKGADSKGDSDRPFSGVYGGLGLMGLIEPNGNGNSLETSCSQIGASSCSTPPPLGGSIFGYGGYSWDPIGLEIFLAAQFDEETPSANYTANSSLGSVVGGPPRIEQFILPRLGGVAALRARATLDGKVFRVSFSAGPGLAYKDMFLVRKATTQDGTNRTGKEVSDSVSYVSPALVADVALHFRVSGGFAFSGGIMTLFENAGETQVATQNQIIGGSSGAAPLRTYAYDAASGAQFFVGPYLGVEFGP